MLLWNINCLASSVSMFTSIPSLTYFFLSSFSLIVVVLFADIECMLCKYSGCFLWEWISKKNTKMFLFLSFFQRNNYLHFSSVRRNVFASSSSPTRSIALVCNCILVFPLKNFAMKRFFSSSLRLSIIRWKKRIIVQDGDFPDDFLHTFYVLI